MFYKEFAWFSPLLTQISKTVYKQFLLNRFFAKKYKAINTPK